VQEALARARRHTQRAIAEALAAARALLDAASLGLSGEPAEAHRGLGALSSALQQASAQLSDDSAALTGPVVEAILDALDHEIARWELRSSDDAEARAVLRAFLGMREILWEFGLRRGDAPSSADPTPRSGGGLGKSGSTGRPARRVQRVRVQG
jgi:hypothetical protein